MRNHIGGKKDPRDKEKKEDSEKGIRTTRQGQAVPEISKAIGTGGTPINLMDGAAFLGVSPVLVENG